MHYLSLIYLFADPEILSNSFSLKFHYTYKMNIFMTNSYSEIGDLYFLYNNIIFILTLKCYLMFSILISAFSLFPINVPKKIHVFLYLCFHSHYATGLKCPFPFNFFMCKLKPHHPFNTLYQCRPSSITIWFLQTEVTFWTLNILSVSLLDHIFPHLIVASYVHMISYLLETKLINGKVYI